MVTAKREKSTDNSGQLSPRNSLKIRKMKKGMQNNQMESIKKEAIISKQYIKMESFVHKLNHIMQESKKTRPKKKQRSKN